MTDIQTLRPQQLQNENHFFSNVPDKLSDKPLDQSTKAPSILRFAKENYVGSPICSSKPSTLNPQPSTLNPQPSTLNPQP